MEAQNFNETRWQRFDERLAVEIRYLKEKMEKLEQENEGLKKKVADRDAVIQALNIKHKMEQKAMEEYEARLLQITLGMQEQTDRRPDWKRDDLDNLDENVYVQIQDTRVMEADRHARSPTVSSLAAPADAVLTEERSPQMADGDQNTSTLPGPVESLGNHHRQVQPNGDFASSIGNMSSEIEFRALSFFDFPIDPGSNGNSKSIRNKVKAVVRKNFSRRSYDTKL